MSSTRSDPDAEGTDVLFEIRAIAGALRVAAIDPRANVEVVVCGPAGQGTEQLKRIAMRKLARRLARGPGVAGR